jgi:hypothetical protein
MTSSKQVTFGDLTIQEYPIILGDNPACTGCPITIDWGKFDLGLSRLFAFARHSILWLSILQKIAHAVFAFAYFLIFTIEPMRSHTRNLELYEYTRTSTRVHRRKLLIPVQMRSQMLLDAGYTQEQIIRRALEVAEIKNQREETIKSYQLQGFGKFSKSFKATFSKLNLGPKPSKITVIARSA